MELLAHLCVHIQQLATKFEHVTNGSGFDNEFCLIKGEILCKGEDLKA